MSADLVMPISHEIILLTFKKISFSHKIMSLTCKSNGIMSF